MKNKKRVLIIVILIIVVLLSILGLNVYFKNYNKSEFDSYEVVKLNKKEKEEFNLIINDIALFRKANLDKNSITNMDMLKYTFGKLTVDDYKRVNVSPNKIVCQVTDTITFISDNKCKITYFSVSKLDKYKNVLIDYEADLIYQNFNYDGYECVTNGSYYYCLENSIYNNVNLKDYSFIDKVYKKDNKYVLFEYHLTYRYTLEECLLYYESSYCTSEFSGELPLISNDKIKEYGVYYRHEFTKLDDKLILEKSYIVDK